MIKLIITITLLLSMIAGGLFYFMGNNKFYVTFAEAKNLMAGDIVYLTNYPIGKVVEISPDLNGKVSVAVRLDKKYQDHITTRSAFFISPDLNSPNHMCLLVRTKSSEGGRKINDKDKIEGIDSLLVWNSLELADKVHGMVSSTSWKDIFMSAKSLVKDLRKTINNIDINELGSEVLSDIEILAKDIKLAARGKKSERALYELENQINHIQQRLKRMNNSEESKKLQEALNGFQKKIMDEIRQEKSKSSMQ